MITDSKETADNSRRSRKSGNSASRPPTCQLQAVRPFTALEGPYKLSRRNSTDRNERQTNLNVIKLDVDYINSNNMFNDDNKERKHEVGECANAKRNVKEDKQSKLIYNGMIGCFKDSKVKCKDVKDKTVVNEVVETKRSIRFWKAVFDVSYSRIVMECIKEGMCVTGRHWKEGGWQSKRKNLSQKVKRKFKKFYFSRFDTE